jgi:predicted transcriptional regulator
MSPPLLDVGGTDIIALNSGERITASNLPILINVYSRKIKVTSRNLATNQASQVNIVIGIKRTVQNSAIVNLSVPKTIAGHLVINLTRNLSPVSDTVRLRIVTHDVETVLFTISRAIH